MHDGPGQHSGKMSSPPPYALLAEMPELNVPAHSTNNNPGSDTDTDESMPALVDVCNEDDHVAPPAPSSSAGPTSTREGLTHAAITTLIQNIGSLNISGRTAETQTDRYTTVVGDLNAPSNHARREPTADGEARMATHAIRHAIWESIIEEAELSQRHAHARYAFNHGDTNYQRRPNGNRYATMMEHLHRMELTLRRLERLVRARTHFPASGRR
ncbi:hypothetical protein K438DRAFT_864699 [Mycena galopus ATCC 62051]|nr:hypothetical protein K438DRAFT_864699 [Mycena galopus ATCC 62051]